MSPKKAKPAPIVSSSQKKFKSKTF